MKVNGQISEGDEAAAAIEDSIKEAMEQEEKLKRDEEVS